jgi:CTP synthase
VNVNSVIEALDAETIYDVPIMMRKEKLDERVLTKLKLPHKIEPDLESWKAFLVKLKSPSNEITIGLVGKYVELPDAYKSIVESFVHAGAENDCKVNIKWIAAEDVEKDDAVRFITGVDGVLVAPGFGERGIEGKIKAITYIREHKIPFLGICLGMQCAVIEFARNVVGLKKANSTEFDGKTKHPVIDLMENQKNLKMMGGTMRLGAYACELEKGSKAYQVYGKQKIKERHRHRYEFNDKYLDDFNKAGMVASGINPETSLVEVVELTEHPWFVGCQYHPELRSTVQNPHPLFVKFVKAAIDFQQDE